MQIDEIYDFIKYMIKNSNSKYFYDMVNKGDKVLLLSDENNEKIAEYLSIIINQKFNYIANKEIYFNIRDSKIKGYNTIIVLDDSSEEYLKDKSINTNIVTLNQILRNSPEDIINNKRKNSLLYFVVGLLIYYQDRALEVVENIYQKIKNDNIENSNQYDCIVCNSFMKKGIDLYMKNQKSISFIDFMDDNKEYHRMLFLGSYTEEEKKIIDQFPNKDIYLCKLNDDIENIIYGVFFALKNGGEK